MDSGAHRCEGKCGRTVSGNKHFCLYCLAIIAEANLKRQGIEVERDDLQRLIRIEAGV